MFPPSDTVFFDPLRKYFQDLPASWKEYKTSFQMVGESVELKRRFIRYVSVSAHWLFQSDVKQCNYGVGDVRYSFVKAAQTLCHSYFHFPSNADEVVSFFCSHLGLKELNVWICSVRSLAG
jgi:hypothetical protein